MKRFLLDPQFLIAMVLGPCVWATLFFLQARVDASLDLKVLLMVCLVYPVLEELAFRGFVQTRLLEFGQLAKKWIASISGANLLTSVLFAAAHFLSQPPLWAASVFFPSLAFGYFRERHDSVVPCIILHCWYNTGFFLILK